MNRSIYVLAAVLLLSRAAGAASVLIEEMTWPEVRNAIAAGKSTAIYYAGSTEQNGPHMVLGKHNFIARELARRIADQLGNALVYPVMPFAPTGDTSTRTGHMRFPGTVSVSDDTYAAVARDVALSALAAGFTHVVLMGDHGGGQDALKAVAQALDKQFSAHGARVHYIPDLYFKSQEDVRKLLIARHLSVGSHAGVSDTSELMALDQAGAWIRRSELGAGNTANGVDGDPAQASAELGRELLEIRMKNAVAQIRQLTGRNK
jgi:creatinine amidohydrolase/Fe(II)-dependent formamide hydrolase-like protein